MKFKQRPSENKVGDLCKVPSKTSIYKRDVIPAQAGIIAKSKKPILFNSLLCSKMDSRLRGNDVGFVRISF